MFCVKCGNEVNDDQQFCTNCGERVEAETTNGNVAGKSIEEKSAEILSGVKDTVNNLADKSAKFAEKVKNDEKVNEAVDKTIKTVKSNKNTLIIIGAGIVALILVIALVTANVSTPQKAVKGYFAGIKSKNFSKMIKNTNMSDSYLNYQLQMDEEDFDIKEAKKDLKEELEDLKEDFEDDLDDIKLQLKKIKVLGKTDTMAVVEIKYYLIEDGDKESQDATLYVVKVGNKWVVNGSYMQLLY